MRLSALSLLWATLTSTTVAVSKPVAPRADNSNATTSSFVQSTSGGNITFAVTAVRETGDLYFHLEAPADNSWVCIGTGRGMAGSMMWIVYANAKNDGVTLSTRTVDAHIEPSFARNIDCHINTQASSNASAIVTQNGKRTLVANVLCKNVNKRSSYRRSLAPRNDILGSDGTLNFDSSSQSFIFGLGPSDRTLHSDDQNAGIRRHTVYGTFSLDLKAATVQSANDVNQQTLATVGNWPLKNAKLEDGPENDTDWTEALHAVAMCGTYVILFPIGVVFLRALEKVMWHAVMQGVGVVAIVGGIGLGFYLGREYNHARDVNSAHQIIGLLIGAFTLIQLGLGMVHHIIYRRTKRSTILGKIHLYLGPLVLGVGAANGFLGFNFSGAPRHNILYGVLVGVVFVLLLGILFWSARRRKARAMQKDTARMHDESYEAFRTQPVLSRSEDTIPLRQMPTEEPPPYEGARQVQPRPMV